ncbi:MAG: 5-methyltetrahydropteroyltriglutamate--homocysteine S-methyltransferase, partial [Microbacterium sp.]
LGAQAWAALAAAPVEALAVDLTRGDVPPAAAGLAGKVLVGGVVDGRNVWRGDLDAAWNRLDALRALGAATVAVTTSTSLQHVPHDVEDEPELDARLATWLAFADQKVGQVAVLARGLAEGRDAIAAELDAASAALADRRQAPGVGDGAVRARQAALTEADFARGAYAARVAAQQASLDLPLLPTTTIGSFPQTGDIRRARARHAGGELDDAGYEQFLRDEIARVIDLQEELGLDVLVHGEAERNDMVQYFAENLDGFAVTRNGWVQSYGSRATRPSILWGDVSRPAPITVAWSTFAQSLTERPVKGMLTGPVTILAWSFVRDDQPLGETANQVALALRDEIADLEAAGIRIIQVDEPALRELLPLKRADQPAYLDWSVGSFRLATAGATDATQVHTHLCYSEFAVVIDAIAALDADVTSIEAARSRGEVIGDIAENGFSHGIGPGVYDIHSPRVPSVAEVAELLERAATELPLRQVWVNPDCGLKTRAYPETVAALTNIVEATRRVRDKVAATV